MKKRSFALAMALVLTLALTGCSASRVEPSRGVTGSDSGVYETDNGNDAFQGGGAGGTNDRDNDGRPDSSTGLDDQRGVGRAADDISRDAGDLARDAGDAIGDAVDNVGNAVGDVGRAVR